MVVNLIKAKQMFSLTLPDKIKGQYWLSALDDAGTYRNLISIEAVDGKWVVKSNKYVSVLDAQNKAVIQSEIKPLSFLSLKCYNSDERIILYAEALDQTRQTFSKVADRTRISTLENLQLLGKKQFT